MIINDLETAAYCMKKQLMKTPDVVVEATYAPELSGATPSDAKYYRFIALTQRVLFKNTLVCYLTYRSTACTSSTSPKLSSYEIFEANYSRSSGIKFKLSAYSVPEEAFKQAYLCILEKVGK